MPAALFMARTKSLIRIATELMRGGDTAVSPADIIARVNRELCQNNNDMMFVTLFFGILNPATGEVAYCNAGHNPPYRCSGETLVSADNGKGIILGVRPQAAYRTGFLTLAPNEALFLFTDGVTEAHDPSGALFSEERLEAALRASAGLSSRAVVEKVSDAVKGFVGIALPSDDITMLALRRLNLSAG
jgi:sigma-B regulation protein RsbU (phosphoserine phosphatase)